MNISKILHSVRKGFGRWCSAYHGIVTGIGDLPEKAGILSQKIHMVIYFYFQESVPQFQLLPILLQRADGTEHLLVPAVVQCCRGSLADWSDRQDHHAQRL